MNHLSRLRTRLAAGLFVLLLPILAAAQTSLVGTWVFEGTPASVFNIAFSANGTWTYSYSDGGANYGNMAGSYTLSGSALTMRVASISASGTDYQYPAGTDVGYHVSASGSGGRLVLNFIDAYSFYAGSGSTYPMDGVIFDLVAAGATAPPPAQPVGAPGQDGFTVQIGIIPKENAVTTVSGTTTSQTIEVDLKLGDLFASAGLPDKAHNGFSATSYKVFVGALSPAGVVGPAVTWRLKDATPRWVTLTGGMALPVFMENVQVSSQDARIRVDVTRNEDLSKLKGTEFYIGYGTSQDDMLNNRRYRGIYKVQ